MFKQHKRKLIFSSLLILLPSAAGLLLWNRLPAQMPTHWGVDGTLNGWSDRAAAVFLLPALMLALHWFGLWLTLRDNRTRNQSTKVLDLVFWLCPVISILINAFVYAVSLGAIIEPGGWLMLPAGLAFIFIGNYMPKCAHNHTIGIKIYWTLRDEDNWRATHRFAGKVWVAGGALMLVSVFLPETLLITLLPILFFLMVILPVGYSYRYHLGQVKNGASVPKTAPAGKNGKIASSAAFVFTLVILGVLALMMFTGDIELIYGENSFTIEASYWMDVTIAYDEVEQITYTDTNSAGSRVSGMGSPRLLTGHFRNAEWGSYTRYSYTGCDAAVVISANGHTLVVNGPDIQSTKAIYEQLLLKTTP